MQHKLIKANITGTLLGIIMLLIMFLGFNAIFKEDWLPIISFIVGGSLGNYIAMKYAAHRV